MMHSSSSYHSSNVIILRGDARHLPLPDKSVDLIVTSPPFYALRTYTDGGEAYDGQIGAEVTATEYISNLLDCTREWMRVLKPEGNMFIELGDKYGRGSRRTIHGGNSKSAYADDGRAGQCVPTGQDKSLLGLPWRYAIACTDELGLILRAEIIWNHVNGLPESVTDRVRRGHSTVFHFTKQQKYFAAVDEIREPHAEVSLKRAMPHRANTMAHEGKWEVDMTKACHPLGKLPGSVWRIPTSPLKVPDWVGVDHFASYPPELCRRIILGWSPREICGKCHEGRRPFSDRNFIRQEDVSAERNTDHGLLDDSNGWGSVPRGSTTRSILGYACACTPYTDHPGTKSLRKFNRYANGLAEDSYESDLGSVPRTGPWREYHLDDWDAPETTPGVVVDPFGGTGTSAMVADVLGRTGISVDASYDYSRLARWRTSDPVERGKVLGEKISRKDLPPVDQPSWWED